jgi:[ribosomal protein S5]-alanine N-acetyltransferase
MQALTRSHPARGRRGPLALTVWTIADADSMGAYWARNRARLTPTQPHRDEAFWTAAGQASRIDRAQDDVGAGRMFPFLVRENSELVGEAILSDVSRGPFCSARLGYSVDGARLRLGIASWAVDAVVDIAFTDLALHRIEAATLVHNLASQAVLRRCGFEPIGVAAAYLAIAGGWRDHGLWQRVNPAMPPPAA